MKRLPTALRIANRIAGLVLLIGACLAGTCNDAPASATFIVQFRAFTSPALAMTSIHIAAGRVDVVWSVAPDSEEQVMTVGTGIDVDIPVTDGTISSQFSVLAVQPGYIHQIRFITPTVTAVIDGKTVDVKLPSGPETGLKVKPCGAEPPFPAGDSLMTVVDVPIDTDTQLVHDKGKKGGLLIKPVICGTATDNPTFLAPQYPDGEVFVMFEEGTPDSTAQADASALGATVIRKSRQHPWYTLLLPSDADALDALEQLQSIPEVVVASRNYNAQTVNGFPADFASKSDTTEYWLFQTHTIEAWDATTGDSRVILAIHDSGVNSFHEELQENIFVNTAEIPSAVTTDADCIPLVTPIDISALMLDADGDGATTLRDFNIEPNRTLLLDALTASGRTPKSTTGDVRLDDLIEEGDQNCGLFEDLMPGPENAYVDDLIGWDFVDDDNVPLENLTLQCGILSHGTGVAGVAAATEDGQSIFNDADVRRAPNYVGQAWRARILPVRAIKEGEDLSRDFRIDALGYAIDMGAQIVNMSWSEVCGPDDTTVPVPLRCTQDEGDAKTATLADEFQQAGADQALIVVGGIDLGVNLDKDGVTDLPTELGLPNQISVTAVTDTDTFPTDGKISYGSAYDIAAPGVHMVGLSSEGIVLPSDPDGALFSCKGLYSSEGTPVLLEGTSFAAPQVSGTAVLILAKALQDGDPAPSPTALRSRILDSADVLDSLTADETRVNGGRRLNVCRAVTGGTCL